MRRHRVEEMNCSLASGNGVLVVNEVTALFGEWSQLQSRLGSIVISQRLSWLIRWYLKKSETTRFPYRRRKGFLLLLGGSNQGTKKLFSHGSLIRSYLTILLSFFITGQKHNADLWTKEGIRKFIMTYTDIEQRRSSCYYFSLAPKEVSPDSDLLWWSAEDST
jgi:hypothetical protein